VQTLCVYGPARPAITANDRIPFALPAVTRGRHLATAGWRLPHAPPGQFIEGGWLLALSLILLAGTVWLVRNRAA
jgi:hypothetical protein